MSDSGIDETQKGNAERRISVSRPTNRFTQKSASPNRSPDALEAGGELPGSITQEDSRGSSTSKNRSGGAGLFAKALSSSRVGIEPQPAPGESPLPPRSATSPFGGLKEGTPSLLTGSKASAPSPSGESKWKRATGLAKFIGRLGKAASLESPPPVKDVQPSLKNMSPLQSLLVDLCEVTGYAYGEIWERPVKAKRRGRLFANVNGPSGMDGDGMPRRRTSLLNSLMLGGAAASFQGEGQEGSHSVAGKRGAEQGAGERVGGHGPGGGGEGALGPESSRGRRRASIGGVSADQPPEGPGLLPGGIAAGLPGLESYQATLPGGIAAGLPGLELPGAIAAGLPALGGDRKSVV